MKAVSQNNFGLAIAYVLPGFVSLVGVSFFSPTVREWLTIAGSTGPTVGGFLYVTLGSLAAGLTVSTIRWAVVDTVHHATGVRHPTWDFSKLQQNIHAFEFLNEIHYRYYQFYGNMLVATAFCFSASVVTKEFPNAWIAATFVFIELIFAAGSRDTLRKYYHRVGRLLAEER